MGCSSLLLAQVTFAISTEQITSSRKIIHVVQPPVIEKISVTKEAKAEISPVW